MTDLLAIAVCTYNRGPALGDTLRSLAAIDPVRARVTRIVVIDNNCTDGTSELVGRLAAEPSTTPRIPIELVREPVQGLSAARRCALRHTREALIAFVDDDCIADANFAAALLERFDTQPSAGAVGARISLRWEGPSPPTALARQCADSLAQQQLGDRARQLAPREYLVGAGLALRRAAIDASGWLEHAVLSDRTGTALSSGGDTEICLRLRQAGRELWYEPRARLDHLIPLQRTTPQYLARLIEGTAAGGVLIRWLEQGGPDWHGGEPWARRELARARRKLLRTRLFEPRPQRRLLRLAQRRGRISGAEQVLRIIRQQLQSGVV